MEGKGRTSALKVKRKNNQTSTLIDNVFSSDILKETNVCIHYM